jgi:Zn-dependent protease with chaperone function
MYSTQRKSLFLTVAVAAAAISQSARPAQAAVSEQDEIRYGREVAKQAIKEVGPALPANDPMARRVRAIGAQFARLSDRKNIPYSYTVLRNDKVLNAFAAPGGPIFVTTKLVRATANDAELAYVLGHETAHIDRRHIVKQAEKQQKLGIFGAIAGAVFGRTGQVVGGLATSFQSLKYSRSDENQADAVGVRLMSRLGYDPRAAVTMLGKLGGGSAPNFLSSHPDPKRRQREVNALIQKETLLEVARRAGGPRLSSTENFGGNSENNSDNGYYAPTGNNSNTYPPTNDANYYPPAADTGSTSQNSEIDLGAPLRLRMSTRGDVNVIMAPVGGIAKWAGATASTSSDGLVTVRRGNNTLRLRRNSSVVEIDGETTTMSAPAVVYNNVLYAPLGTIVRALGGSAVLENNVVRLRLNGRESGYVRVP